MQYGQFASHYDRLMADAPYAEWQAFLSAVWNKHRLAPRTVVDLGCGTGRLAIPLAEQGLNVIGVDLSENMLAAANARYEERQREGAFASGGHVIWQEQDMRELELAEPVPCIYSFCDCLNYVLEEEGVCEVFRHVYAGLEEGGLFIFDVHTPRQIEQYYTNQPYVLDEDDMAYIWTCELNEERCEVEHALTIFYQQADGSFQRFEETHQQRAYPLEWIRSELSAAGFSQVASYGDFTFRAPTKATERAFFVAMK
ncbi:class I SAM-dependent DNA methyltransferase [Paenibacillus sp. y28]|uniref:class I SAM-dependent DNA methyltransferase n=1 Tax=Paenibacillus sp. y28 TaxID=3129110 RepID=UPI00301AAF1C